RVKLHFSGINPTDTKLRGGWDGSTEMPFPRVIPHQDGAGVIDKVGAGVPQARIGERVWIYEAQRGRAFGTAAEYVAIPSENAVTLPEGASLELNRAVLKANGVIATYSSGPPDSAPRIPFTAIMRQGISMHFILVYAMPREAHQLAARDLNAALEAGRYRPHVARIFKLDE